jgi:hypothetical protein
MKVTGAESEQELPTIWHDFANCSKAERRPIIAKSLEDASRRPDAATGSPPVVNKAILDFFLGMNLPDELDQSFQLFRFVPGPASHVQETHTQNELFDLVYAGTTTPSLSDIQKLASTKVFLPTDHHGLTTALKRHSLAVDVYLGFQHPFFVFYRRWIERGWLDLHEPVIDFNALYYQDLPGTALSFAKVARWI